MPASKIGRVWARDFEIDIAGRLLDSSPVFGERNWVDPVIGESIRKRLEATIPKSEYAKVALARHLVFFANRGFSEDMKKAAAADQCIQLFELEELVLAPTE